MFAVFAFDPSLLQTSYRSCQAGQDQAVRIHRFIACNAKRVTAGVHKLRIKASLLQQFRQSGRVVFVIIYNENSDCNNRITWQLARYSKLA